MNWKNDQGFGLETATREKARCGLKSVADWAARNQGRHRWPRWSADTGRFPYHVYLKTDDVFRSTSWNTARMVQGLFSAWLVLRDPEHLFTAELALEYVKSIQYFGPECPAAHGLFLAETPMSDHAGIRDGVECGQALLAHHLITGDKVSLIRARAYFDRLITMVDNGAWLAEGLTLVPRLKPVHFLENAGPSRTVAERWCDHVAALPLLQLAQATNEKSYLAAADRFGGFILETLCRPDGSICAANGGHHISTPEGYLDNDDGIVVALLSLWQVLKKKQYLDAAVANAEWWLKRADKLPANYTTVSVLTMNMADVARATGDSRFSRFLQEKSEDLFRMQVSRDERPLVAGAFMGEDMAPHYRKGSAAGDFISLRSTSYGALALGRLACTHANEWNPSYSAFGWER